MNAVDDFAIEPADAIKPATPEAGADLFDVLTPVPAADVSHVELNSLLDLDERVYNADMTAVRKGWLDQINRSPAHLQAYRAGLIPQTDAMGFGQLLHTFVLEADLIESRYYREPECDKRTKAGKALAAEVAAENAGKRGFKPADFDLGLAMRDAVYRHRAARKVLEAAGGFEKSIFWKNKETELLCKARFDKVSKDFIADLKSTLDASLIGFGKSIVNFRYTVSAAHYSEPNGLPFLLIACEKQPPFCVAVYRISPEDVAKGQRDRLPNLRRYAECLASNQWPGYEDDTIHFAQLPAWYR